MTTEQLTLDDIENAIMMRVHDTFQELRIGKVTTERQPRAPDLAPDLASVIWNQTIGRKGPFDLATPTKNQGNVNFDRLTSYLKGRSGTVTIQNCFVWLFSDGSGFIGKKPR